MLVPVSVSGPRGPRSLCDGDPVSGSRQSRGASWRSAPRGPAGVGEPDPSGRTDPERGRGGPEVGPPWDGPPGHQETSGGTLGSGFLSDSVGGGYGFVDIFFFLDQIKTKY